MPQKSLFSRWISEGRDVAGLSLEETSQVVRNQTPFQHGIKDAIPYIIRLLRYYRHGRLLGIDIEMEGDFFYGTLFNSLWRWKSAMSRPVRASVFEAVEDIQLHVLLRRNAVMRPEFAFLTGWTGSLAWAWPHRAKFAAAEHGIPELQELVESVPKDSLVKDFFGMGERKHVAWTSMGDPPDGGWVCTVLGLDRDLLRKHILPSETRLADEIRRFAVGNAGD